MELALRHVLVCGVFAAQLSVSFELVHKIHHKQGVYPKIFKPVQGVSAVYRSSQITELELYAIAAALEIKLEDIVLIDLQAEPKLLINGQPVAVEGLSFLNPQDLEWYEDGLARYLIKPGSNISVTCVERVARSGDMYKSYRTFSTQLQVIRVETERQMAQRLGIAYMRVPNIDHEKPTMQSLMLFLYNIQSLLPFSPSQKIIIHCRGGKGRSSFYSALIDLVFNCDQKPLSAILRQNTELLTDGRLVAAQKIALLRSVYTVCNSL